MVSRLLDSDVCIEILRGLAEPQRDRLRSWAPLAVSTVTAAELAYGAERSGRPAHALRQVDVLLEGMTVLPLDEASARRAGAVRAALARAGTPIGPHDVLIAATALTHDLPLVTGNVREFQRVTGLVVEPWPHHRGG